MGPFCCRHAKGCELVNMLKRLDYLEIAALLFYLDADDTFYFTTLSTSTSWTSSNWNHRKLFEENHFEIKRGLLVANTMRFNMYHASDYMTA